MNIFFLDRDPAVAAQYHHDKHVVKMVLETAQLLCTAAAAYGRLPPYKPTHTSHPSAVWTRASRQHYAWLARLGLSLCGEYSHRYGKVHKTQAVIEQVASDLVYIPSNGWVDPPQCMPDEFKRSDAVSGYQAYYLGAKLHQSGWSRRPVPPFIGEMNMATAKKASKKPAPAPDPVVEEVTEGAQIGVRGPKGVSLDAKITLKTEANPKRVGSRAHTLFDLYVDGMTVGEYLAACSEAGHPDQATPCLQYDASHGFVEIEGFDPKAKFVPKAKAEKKAAEPKAKKGKKSAAVEVEVEDEEVVE